MFVSHNLVSPEDFLSKRFITSGSALTMVKKKLKTFNQKVQPKQAKPILCDPDVKSYPEALDNRAVVVAIERPANNFAFISKTQSLCP